MPQVDVNLMVVLVAAIAAMVIGSLWYSPLLFVKEWSKLAKLDSKDKQNSPAKAMTIAAVMALITAYVLAHIIAYSGATTLTEGLVTGFWVWLGFFFTTAVMQGAFETKPMKLTAITVGNSLVTMLVMGSILASWR